MTEKLPDELEYSSIQELLNEKNPLFYSLLKRILNLKLIRAVELGTFLLNFSIQYNYFRWFQVLIKDFPDKLPQNDDAQGLQEYLIGSERISGLILLLCLNYKTKSNLNQQNTDKEINDLHLSIPLNNQFFMFNTLARKFYRTDFIELLNTSASYKIFKTLMPDLGFDPDYEPVLKSEAIKQTYKTNSMKDFLNNKDLKPPKYLPDKKLTVRFIHSYQNLDKKLFDIDSNLTISQFMLENTNDLGGFFFSSEKQIDDIIEVFNTYYCKKVPSIAGEITSYLSCFGEILKICEGRLYVKTRYTKIKAKLKPIANKSVITSFLKRVCLKKINKTFSPTFNQFNPKRFLSLYNRFLSYCMFNVSGVVYLGIMTVWRALIKYLEDLLQEKEFKLGKKGALLENWAYEKAVEYGFEPIKLILINPNKEPTTRYHKMKNQVKDFKGSILEFEASFIEEHLNSSFEEIDLAIKIDDTLYIFDCKGTSTARGEQDRFLTWIEHFQDNINDIHLQGQILLHNITNGLISVPFLDGVKHIVPYQIQNEGIFFTHYVISTTGGYEKFLKELKEKSKLKTT